MEKEREDKILGAIVRQREDMLAGFKSLGDQNKTVIRKLKGHDGQFEKINGRFDQMDGRFDRVESAVLDNSAGIEGIGEKVERVESAVLENRKDIKDIKQSLNTAITSHEQRIRKLETKAGV